MDVEHASTRTLPASRYGSKADQTDAPPSPPPVVHGEYDTIVPWPGFGA
jgi:hypothetical protein